MNNELEEQLVNGFKKFDQDKLQWHLMPEDALEEIVKVLMIGAKKYGDFNWLDNANQVQLTRYLNAMERHLKSLKRGRDRDAETNLLEAAHVATNALFVITMQLRNLGIDNRRKDLK